MQAGPMSKQVYEYKSECPKCAALWVGEVRWTFCPTCGVALRMVAAVLCDPLPTASKLHNTKWRAVKMPLVDKPALTLADVAERMGFSTQTVIKLFEREPGVIILKRPEKMHKRSYRSVRIPRAVYERVVTRLSV